MTNLVAVLVWLLLLVIVVGLSLLLWTRWGQYRPFAKCLGLSIVLHAALLLFGSTVELAHRLKQPEEHPEEVVWLERVETEAIDEFVGLGGDAPLNEPWDRLTPARDLTSPELDYTPPTVTPPQPTRARREPVVMDRSRPLPDSPNPIDQTADPELLARRERIRPEQLLPNATLTPGVPDVTDRATMPPMPVSGPLTAPETVQHMPRLPRRGTELTLDSPVGLPDPQLRIEPHELSEPVARRDLSRQPSAGPPALADELPLRPEVPEQAEHAPAPSSRAQGLVTADPLPQQPVAEAGMRKRTRRSGRQRLERLAAKASIPDVVSIERTNPKVAGFGERPATAARRDAAEQGSGIPREASRTGLSPEVAETARRVPQQDRLRQMPTAGLLGPTSHAAAGTGQRPVRRRLQSRPGLRRLDERLTARPLPAVSEPEEVVGHGIPARSKAALAAVPSELRLRVSPQRREILLRRGGSPETEQAVEAALAWLAAHQSADGRWDADGFAAACPKVQPCGGEGTLAQGDTAITGLALLAFLGAGHTHQGGPYAETVAAGLRWLVAQETGDGDVRGGGRMYAQGIATIALCEAYALSRDPALRAPAQRAALFVARAQNPATGAWRYQPQAVIGDTSVFGWQLLALRSAKLAGFEIPAVVWQRARAWLPRVSWGKAGGLASYLERSVDRHGPTPPMTAEALACRLFLGAAPEDPQVQEAVAYLLENLPDYRLRNVYYWYYASLSLSQVGGRPWQLWNEQMKAILLRTQRRSGHAKGSWDPAYNVAWDTVGGRIYTTALSTLCLEVYYRYAYQEPLVATPSAQKSPATARTARRDER